MLKFGRIFFPWEAIKSIILQLIFACDFQNDHVKLKQQVFTQFNMLLKSFLYKQDRHLSNRELIKW